MRRVQDFFGRAGWRWDGPIFRHSRAGGNPPRGQRPAAGWIPACAGM